MKTMKLLATVLVWSLMMPAMNAQNLVQKTFDLLVNNKNVSVSSNLASSTTPALPGNPLTSMCNVYTFSMRNNYKFLLDDILTAFNQEKNGSNCYSSEQRINDNSKRIYSLYIGDDVNNTIDIGTDRECNYIAQCWRDSKRRTYRYAYAAEWKNDDDNQISGRLIITYAKIHNDNSNGNSITSGNSDNAEYPQDITLNIRSSEEALAVFSRLKDLADMNIKALNSANVSTDEKNSVEYTAMSIYQTVKQTKLKYSFTSGEKKLLKSELTSMIKRLKEADHTLNSNVSYTKNCILANSIVTSINYLELTKKIL